MLLLYTSFAPMSVLYSSILQVTYLYVRESIVVGVFLMILLSWFVIYVWIGRIAVSGFEISHERERSVQANCKLETELTRQSHHSKQNIPLVMVVKRVLKAAKAVGERIFFVSAFLN